MPTEKEKNPSPFSAGLPWQHKSNNSPNQNSENKVVTLLVRNGEFPLLGAIEEVEQIAALLKGKSWIGTQATESNFKTKAKDFKILHLATHGRIDDDNPLQSELLFASNQDSIEDGYLNIREIYNLDLNAELVVLSACNSGYGKVQLGEGNMSLSRAFSYAGCPSIIMSLWKVPDKITKDLMISLYNNFLVEKDKDEALQQAKLTHISSVEDPIYAHPYYWAGFVLMGNTDPIVTDRNSP